MVKRDMFYFADIDEKFIDSTKDNERYASDDYEILTHEEYIDYINNFYELLNELKKIRSEFE